MVGFGFNTNAWYRNEVRWKLYETRWYIVYKHQDNRRYHLRKLVWGPLEWTAMQSITFRDFILTGKWEWK